MASSSPKHSLADQVRRLATQYEAMVTVADMLEKMGSAENYLAEVERKIAERNDNLVALDNKVADLTAKCENIRAQAKAHVEQAEESAAQALALGNEEVRKLIAKAREDGDKLVEKAKAKAEAIDAQTREIEAKAATTEKLMIEKLTALDGDIAEKEKLLAAIEKKLADARSRAAKILEV